MTSRRSFKPIRMLWLKTWKLWMFDCYQRQRQTTFPNSKCTLMETCWIITIVVTIVRCLILISPPLVARNGNVNCPRSTNVNKSKRNRKSGGKLNQPLESRMHGLTMTNVLTLMSKPKQIIIMWTFLLIVVVDLNETWNFLDFLTVLRSKI